MRSKHKNKSYLELFYLTKDQSSYVLLCSHLSSPIFYLFFLTYLCLNSVTLHLSYVHCQDEYDFFTQTFTTPIQVGAKFPKTSNFQTKF